MPAGLPGDSLFNNQGNPSEGNFVTFDPLSGPKDSPFDAKVFDYTTGSPPGWNATTRLPIKVNDDSNISTGGLSTGIGIGCEHVIRAASAALAPYDIFRAGFDDNLTPGKDVLTYAAAPPNGVVATDEFDSTFMYIGGGRMVASTTYPGVPFIPSPYTAGVAICGAGQGGSRDSGANTGFALKMVTATGAAANGAAIEAGYTNRSGVALAAFDSAFGSASVALATAS